MIVQHRCMILHILEMDDAGTREAAHVDLTNRRQSAREVQRVHAIHDELVERIARAIRDDGTCGESHTAPAPRSRR